MSSEVTLFLIEDNDIDAMMVERMLHDCQLVSPVVRAHDGLEALELLHAGKCTQTLCNPSRSPDASDERP